MAFIYGSQDTTSAAVAKSDLDAIARATLRNNPGTTEAAVKNLLQKKGIGSHILARTKVTGSDLLTANDSEAKWIVNVFLKSVMEERRQGKPETGE